MEIRKEDKIITEKDVFLNVALKRGITVEEVERVYNGFLKGIEDKIIEEDIISIHIEGVGNLVQNMNETRYYLHKHKSFTKEPEEIKRPLIASLKRRYLKTEEHINYLRKVKEERYNFDSMYFFTPHLYRKAIHFYTSFKYYKHNFRGDRYLFTLKEIEKRIEKIFYDEDKRYN